MTESAEGSRIIQAGVAALDAGGGAGHPDRVSSTEIPARAGDGGADHRALLPAGIAVSGMDVSSLNSPGAAAPGAFFDWGSLTPTEDRELWRLRRKGWSFDMIAVRFDRYRRFRFRWLARAALALSRQGTPA